MPVPTLYIFSGLPASGKTTIARLLAQYCKAAYFRIDSIEQGLRDLCNCKVEGEGYRLSYRVAKDNLELGLSVIADSCNPIQLTRDEWQAVASSAGARFVNIEILCSDSSEHKQRVETRSCSIENLRLPTWEQVRNRHYEPWNGEIIKIDTAHRTPEASFNALLEKLGVS